MLALANKKSNESANARRPRAGSQPRESDMDVPVQRKTCPSGVGALLALAAKSPSPNRLMLRSSAPKWNPLSGARFPMSA